MPPDQHVPTPLPSPSWREWILLLLRKRIRVQVTGESMLPTLKPGDIVLVDIGAYVDCKPSIGDIIVAHHPFQRNLSIIKRIADITSDGRLMLQSDNSQVGTDSRSFGTIRMQRVIGRVTSCSRLDAVY